MNRNNPKCIISDLENSGLKSKSKIEVPRIHFYETCSLKVLRFNIKLMEPWQIPKIVRTQSYR